MYSCIRYVIISFSVLSTLTLYLFHLLGLSIFLHLMFFLPTSPPPPSIPHSVLAGLYPNLEELGDYMGLALNSDEVQRNLALVPVADNVSISVCPGDDCQSITDI